MATTNRRVLLKSRPQGEPTPADFDIVDGPVPEPKDGEYRVHTVHRPGEQFDLPESIGALVTMDVDSMLGPVK